MNEITLFEFQSERIEILITLYFNTLGQLVLDGYDKGENVEDYWGDPDYEYSYTVSPKGIKKLYALLEVNPDDRETLLLEIKNRFGGNRVYSEFGEFMTENDVDYTGSTWI